ncbi:MAG: PQ-loop repeat-containing protein [Acidobacteria bacterium]|nr:PQ-loop repeat-containing protein [Acidobacteriota bacterium]
MNISQIVGFSGTGLVIVGYIPQIHHLIKEQCTAGLSVPAFAVWCSASLLFLIHATMIRDVVFVGVQVVNLAASGIIVAFCKRYAGQVCPSHAPAYSASAREDAS